MQRPSNTLDTLLTDADRTLRRQRLCKKNINDNINKVILEIEKTKENIGSGTDQMEEEVVPELKDKLQSLWSSISGQKPLNNILNAHKEYFAYVSKFGKDLDKVFNKDINHAFQDYSLDKDLILKLIAEHFTREGKFELNESLRNEAEGLVQEEFEQNFKLIHNLLAEIRNRNLTPAISWAEQNQKLLDEIESDLLFRLHRQQFISVLESSGKEKAIQYARAHFLQFSQKYQREIQQVMTSLLYSDFEHCRYAELFDSSNWEEIASLFLEEACRMHNTTPQSSLYFTLSAGTLALPKFLKYFALSMLHNSKTKESEEFPIAMDLGRDFQFHSIFVCPVTKEVSTHDNPPMLLKCGHVISEYSIDWICSNVFTKRHAIKKIAGTRSRFKCPYCPAEQINGNARKLSFN